MSQLTATVGQAARWVRGASGPERNWNPVYRALAEGATDPPTDPPAAPGLDLLRHQFTAPALLVVAVTHAEGTRCLRYGLTDTAATLESVAGGPFSQWSATSLDDARRRVDELLEGAGVGSVPARLHIRRSAEARSLTPAQSSTAQTALARGAAPGDALTAVPDLDEDLRDALTATGPRISLSLTLHDPLGRELQRPMTWSRLWVTGGRGLYRLDQPSTPVPAVHPVGDGDVAGTLHPILEQGLRFAAACRAPESER